MRTDHGNTTLLSTALSQTRSSKITRRATQVCITLKGQEERRVIILSLSAGFTKKMYILS